MSGDGTMTDDLLHGLGANQSAPDDADFDISGLYAAAGIPEPVALPVAWVAGNLPPVLNQHATPMCVAYSSAGMKAWQDRDDGPSPVWYDFDEPLFFARIGGGPGGAYPRNAMRELKAVGYPTHSGGPSSAAAHRIASYWSVPVTQNDICAAILALGPVVIALPWANSWFHPNAQGVLPPFDSQVGGHAIMAIGWDARGLRLQNSWGAGWGVSGDCILPWSELDRVWECWKAADVPAPPKPKPVSKTFVLVKRGDTLSAIAAHAGITLARLLAFPENAKYRANPSLIHVGDKVRVK